MSTKDWSDTKETGARKPENYAWQDWMSILTHEEEHQIAIEVGFARLSQGYDLSKEAQFERAVDQARLDKIGAR